MDFIIKGMLIGVIFGVPAGTIGALTIQRTMKQGFAAGFITGLGSTVADLIYACMGVFGLSFVSDVMLTYQKSISSAGGVIIIGLEIWIFFQKKKKELQRSTGKTMLVSFLSSFMIAITNPTTILTFILVFATMNVSNISSLNQGIGLLFGIAVGTSLWWFALSKTISLLRRRITDRIYTVMNYILGGFMIVFGIVILVRNLV